MHQLIFGVGDLVILTCLPTVNSVPLQVAYGAKTNNTVIVRSNDIASRPWFKGSSLM